MLEEHRKRVRDEALDVFDVDRGSALRPPNHRGKAWILSSLVRDAALTLIMLKSFCMNGEMRSALRFGLLSS